METTPTALDGVVIVHPPRFGDDRGYFSETFNVRSFNDAGLPSTYVQDNESLSGKVGTVRGIHYQIHPDAQDKLVRVIQGAVLDVAVDLRRSSPTFGHHVAVELTSESGDQLLVPIGFGHAFCTLTPDTIVAYKVTGYYSPTSDRGIRWDDPAIGIAWPVEGAAATVSAKDAEAPALADATDLFD